MTHLKDGSNGNEGVGLMKERLLHEGLSYKTHWKIEKFDLKMKKVGEDEIDGNMMVNTGINVLTTLLAGVGDASTAEATGQTDLQAATNKLRKAMNVSFPTYGSVQQIVFQADFVGVEANYAWNEFGVFNASTAGTMLNRKVSAQGTKIAGQTWRVTVTITFS